MNPQLYAPLFAGGLFVGMELMATRRHTPRAIFGVLALLALASSFIAGFALAASKSRHWVHTPVLTVVIASIVYLIVDIELPLLGLIRIVDVNENLVELRQSMTPKN